MKKTASWLLESLLALPLMKVFICAVLLLAVKPSELAWTQRVVVFLHTGAIAHVFLDFILIEFKQ